MQDSERIAVIGLGYVGLPVALAIGRRFPGTIGFDISKQRVSALGEGRDTTGEVSADDLRSASLEITNDEKALEAATFFIVAVPTPIDGDHRPDLGPLSGASRIVGRALSPGNVVVYESTVYPGVTERICGPLLAEVSGLEQGRDFKLGYSPERINPGDKEHSFEKIMKVVSGEDSETLERVAAVYGSVVEAGIHRAPNIQVAEAAKVIENIQRDLNIALMNELAVIFDRVGIRTKDVLEAAGTKWNFLKFEPGLVGGHCIGVDPYYLTTLADQLGYHPQVILAGRRINESMGPFVAQQLVKMLARSDVPPSKARVAVLGMTFKPNVPDLRNSKVVDIIAELRQFGIEPMVHDPVADQDELSRVFGLRNQPWSELSKLDGVILAVPHDHFLQMPRERLFGLLEPGGAFLDVKSVLSADDVPDPCTYWSL